MLLKSGENYAAKKQFLLPDIWPKLIDIRYVYRFTFIQILRCFDHCIRLWSREEDRRVKLHSLMGFWLSINPQLEEQEIQSYYYFMEVIASEWAINILSKFTVYSYFCMKKLILFLSSNSYIYYLLLQFTKFEQLFKTSKV